MKRGTIEHPKTRALAKQLRCNLAHAVGILECMWHFVARFAPAGDIGRFSDDEIAQALYWESRAGAQKLIDALVSCRWLERHETHRLIVHDWGQHCEQSVRRYLDRNGQCLVMSSQTQAMTSQELAMTRLPKPKPKPLPEPIAEAEAEATPAPEPPSMDSAEPGPPPDPVSVSESNSAPSSVSDSVSDSSEQPPTAPPPVEPNSPKGIAIRQLAASTAIANFRRISQQAIDGQIPGVPGHPRHAGQRASDDTDLHRIAMDLVARASPGGEIARLKAAGELLLEKLRSKLSSPVGAWKADMRKRGWLGQQQGDGNADSGA